MRLVGHKDASKDGDRPDYLTKCESFNSAGEATMPFGIAGIFVILLITIGPMKAAFVFATLTAKNDLGLIEKLQPRT